MKLFIAVLLVLVQACDFAEAKPAKDKPYLVSAEQKIKASPDDLKQDYALAAAYIKNGYTAYRITYNTTNTDGKAVVASGALFVPDIKGALPLLNYNHGTLFPSREHNAPSYLGGADEISMGKLFAGAGYLVVMPDYIGYGSSKQEKHPYGAYHYIGQSVVDMLQAVKEFCLKNNITLSGKHFYSGWSEGAAVALATVKILEEKYKGQFTPTASVLNAGPYYTSGFLDHIMNARQPLRYMASYAWILKSYSTIYKIGQPFSYYFNEPAATELSATPERYTVQDPQQLFTTRFRESYKAGNEKALEAAMQANDLWDWKPQSRIVFCHGDKDEYVPLFSSEKAYNAMKEKGADVSLQVFKGQNHTSGVLGFVQQLFGTFEKYK